VKNKNITNGSRTLKGAHYILRRLKPAATIKIKITTNGSRTLSGCALYITQAEACGYHKK